MGITQRDNQSDMASATKQQPVLETIRLNLTRFAETMDNKKAVPAEVGVRMQMLMLGTLRMIFRLEEEAFNEAFGYLVSWAKENIENSMKREARYRYMHMCKEMSKQDHSVQLMVVGLVCMIADAKARQQVLTRFDFHRIDAFWTSTGGGDKMSNYFAQLQA